MKQKCIIQTQFDFAGGFFAQNHSTFRQGTPLRLWERFDFGSTFKPVRLWQRDADRRTLTATPSGPADAPQDGPSLGKRAFWVHMFAKSLFSEHKIDVATCIKFWKQPKSTKVHKKSASGDAGSAGIHSTFKPIRLSFYFARRVQGGECNARRVVRRGVTCLHRAPAALDRPARYSFGCFALRAPHHRGFARRPLLWAVL